MSGPVVAELVISADSITPGKKPVRYAIIVTKNAYTTATYLIVFSCPWSSYVLKRGNRHRKSSNVQVANEFKFDTVTLRKLETITVEEHLHN